jgi:hypothetical protein
MSFPAARLFATLAVLWPLAATSSQSPQPPLLEIDFIADGSAAGSFDVKVGGTKWLGSGPIRVFAAGAWASQLTRAGATHYSGSDVLV